MPDVRIIAAKSKDFARLWDVLRECAQDSLCTGLAVLLLKSAVQVIQILTLFFIKRTREGAGWHIIKT